MANKLDHVRVAAAVSQRLLLKLRRILADDLDLGGLQSPVRTASLIDLETSAHARTLSGIVSPRKGLH